MYNMSITANRTFSVLFYIDADIAPLGLVNLILKSTLWYFKMYNTLILINCILCVTDNLKCGS